MAMVQRTLQRSELRILAILGVPTFALALAITTVSTYLPVLAEDFSDSTIVIGLLIGGEGLIALWLPLVVGSWSDRLRTPLGRRLPFIIAPWLPLFVGSWSDRLAPRSAAGCRSSWPPPRCWCSRWPSSGS
jgi:MFS family permease